MQRAGGALGPVGRQRPGPCSCLEAQAGCARNGAGSGLWGVRPGRGRAMWLCPRLLLWKPDSCGQTPGSPFSRGQSVQSQALAARDERLNRPQEPEATPGVSGLTVGWLGGGVWKGESTQAGAGRAAGGDRPCALPAGLGLLPRRPCSEPQLGSDSPRELGQGLFCLWASLSLSLR